MDQKNLWTAYFWLAIFPGAHRLYLGKPRWWLLPLLFAAVVVLSLTHYLIVALVAFLSVLAYDIAFLPKMIHRQ